MAEQDNSNKQDPVVLCDVYKSVKQPEVYLYVSKSDGLNRVPVELLERFVDLEFSFTFKLTKNRKLAREDSAKVLANLSSQGYHLQMPPVILGQVGRTDTK